MERKTSIIKCTFHSSLHIPRARHGGAARGAWCQHGCARPRRAHTVARRAGPLGARIRVRARTARRGRRPKRARQLRLHARAPGGAE